MYSILPTSRFKRDLKRIAKQRKNIDKLESIVGLLAQGKALPAKNKDHVLVGNYAHHRECHIEPDWLLIYRFNEDEAAIILARTGSHSDLFS